MRNRPVRRKTKLVPNGDPFRTAAMITGTQARSGQPRRAAEIGQAVAAAMRLAGVGAAEMLDPSRRGLIAAALRDGGIKDKEEERMCSGEWLRVPRAVRG